MEEADREEARRQPQRSHKRMLLDSYTRSFHHFALMPYCARGSGSCNIATRRQFLKVRTSASAWRSSKRECSAEWDPISCPFVQRSTSRSHAPFSISCVHSGHAYHENPGSSYGINGADAPQKSHADGCRFMAASKPLEQVLRLFA